MRKLKDSLSKLGKETAAQTTQTSNESEYLVDWLAEWPQEVARQLPAKHAWRVKDKINEDTIFLNNKH